jgi:hypothetical protein
MSAPNWTNKIPNAVVCNYFYVFFMVFAVWAALSLVGGVWIFSSTKMSLGMLVGFIFNIILSFGISATSALFLYLICERALKPLSDESYGDSEYDGEEGFRGGASNRQPPKRRR